MEDTKQHLFMKSKKKSSLQEASEAARILKSGLESILQ